MASQKENIAQSVELVYAAALLELAEQSGDLDAVGQEMVDLGAILTQQPELGRLLSSRVLSAAERSASIDRIFKGKVSDLVYRFLQVVSAKGRMDLLPQIVEAFQEALDRNRGVIHVDAHVAVALNAGETQGLVERLGTALGGSVVLHQKVDPALIGGLKLRIGDKMIDGSVSTQLRKMKQQIVAAGRANARGRIKELVNE